MVLEKSGNEVAGSGRQDQISKSFQIAKLEEGEICAEDSELSEGGKAGLKLGDRLFHGCDFNASGKKAVSLESLAGLRCLKSFVLL
jgi:hypothetical protein